VAGPRPRRVLRPHLAVRVARIAVPVALVIVLGVGVGVSGAVIPGAGAQVASTSSRSKLALSLNPDRSSAVRLDGATVKAKIYVFVRTSKTLDKVDFYLDGQSPTKSPVGTDEVPPYDFAGTAADGTALPYDTTNLTDGPHTIRAVLTWSDGTTSSRRGDLRVANSDATAPPTTTATATSTTKPPPTATPPPTTTPPPTAPSTARPTEQTPTKTPSVTPTDASASPTPSSTAPSTTSVTPNTPAPTTTGSGGGGPCSGTPGAGGGATSSGVTTYSAGGTTTVTNRIFDASHSVDLVRVTNGHVIFDHVTFRGTGTGTFGHSLLIMSGGSAEIRNSKFEGAPVEDSIQTINNGATLIECNSIGGTPGEDHIDTKSGGVVTIQNNAFTTVPPMPGRTLEIQNRTSPVHAINNTGVGTVFYEEGQTSGTIVDNAVSVNITLYDTTNILVEGNTTPLIKHGEFSGTRDPVGIYYLNNQATSFQMNGGNCFTDGNTGASFASCTAWHSRQVGVG
jgi:hypothetical protein